jgi:UDP-N-acetylglucosamine--N-acetylmuramyl-(pentapeptide) pyrophosphoryl-undecaprenol N-acetylglucosamine transferase
MIRAMLQLLQSPERAATFEGWQVLHQCGTFDVDLVQRAYDAARIEAKVVPYCDQMGLAWSGAEVVLSRAGAGSVAEAWANAAPTIFMPNPYHRDQHQRHNAGPLVAAGGAEILADEIDATRNARALGPVLERLMRDPDRRDGMRRALQQTRPPDGAARVAEWIGDRLAGPSSKRGTS